MMHAFRIDDKVWVPCDRFDQVTVVSPSNLRMQKPRKIVWGHACCGQSVKGVVSSELLALTIDTGILNP